MFFPPRHWSRCGLTIALGLVGVNFLTNVMQKETSFHRGNALGDRDSLDGISVGGRDSLNGNSMDSKHRWIKVSKSELDEYRAKETKACGRPFEHCCLGQGRQLLTNSFNDTSHLEVKWTGPTSDLTSVLDAMHDNDVPCNLMFVGMSTSEIIYGSQLGLVIRSLHSSGIIRWRYGNRKSLRAVKGRLQTR